MLNDRQRTELLQIARAAIEEGLATGREMRVNLAGRAPELRQSAATFVTLKKNRRLRGCIGTLEAHRPLAQDVASNAYAAAFRDPRFSPLAPGELDQLAVSISLLSAPEPLPVESEQELLEKLQPGRDGLVLQDGAHRATFLPAVWEELAKPVLFLG
ncbi:MAG: AmmeMemoRadiSam system protein A, partial [Pseudomonadota bacterium]|nr:AmmeMemoRadiSam system protein A [Pseudomonadota bacterium]